MSLLIGLLTFLLFFNCLFLILLVLIQLPKKEAGAGAAFGGAATDALFGAGSGNALTKITKYSTIVFFGLVLILSTLQSRRVAGSKDEIGEELKNVQAPAAPVKRAGEPTNMLSIPSTPSQNPTPSSPEPLPPNQQQ